MMHLAEDMHMIGWWHIALSCTILRSTLLNYNTPMNFATLHNITILHNALHCTTIHTIRYITLHSTNICCTVIHRIILHDTTIHKTTLHCTALHQITLHGTILCCPIYATPHYKVLINSVHIARLFNKSTIVISHEGLYLVRELLKAR